MQTATPRGIRAGGLQGSMWARDGGASWSSRGTSSYVPRRSGLSSTINPIVPLPPPPASSGNWWENTPPPVLKGSAKPTPAATPTPERQGFTSSQQELRRYVQIVRRMKWKLPYLEDGYYRAIGEARTPENMQWAKENPDGWEAERQEAELHFKLDFYEYYMLLERALVHLLGVFGTSVSAQPLFNGKGPAQAPHSYHQNVLHALEKKDSPLYAALGSGEVRRCLGEAKDLRNRWKHAEHPQFAANGTILPTRPLMEYRLVDIMKAVFHGFDEGYIIAERWVADLAQDADMVLTDVNPGGEQHSAAERVEEEFRFIVDAMDWEAVYVWSADSPDNAGPPEEAENMYTFR